MVGESTTLSFKCIVITYISSYVDAKVPIIAFLDLVELCGQDAETIEKVLWSCLER